MTIMDPPPVTSGKGVYIGSVEIAVELTHPYKRTSLADSEEQSLARDWRDKFKPRYDASTV